MAPDENSEGVRRGGDHIEGAISELKTDRREHRQATDRNFRLLFGALIVAVLGLAGLMAKGFHWL